MNSQIDERPALVCVDWGSTNFRASLLNAKGELLDRISSDRGMLKLRREQFEPTLMQQIEPWLAPNPLPVLMAGMVGSQQGWYEAAYVCCPASMASLGENLVRVPNAANLQIAIVPGVKGQSLFGQPDVMRGEEVQIVGALALLRQMTPVFQDELVQDQALLCLPGTHSKWARIGNAHQRHAQILDFATQMTGELYSLLDKYSILGRMGQIEKPVPAVNTAVFDRAIDRSQENGGLSHHLFSARTNVLAGTLSSADVGSYLSGLLVGTEVKAMLTALPETQTVYLVGNDTLNNLYRHALVKAGVRVRAVNGDEAACMGMVTIARQAGLLTHEEA